MAALRVVLADDSALFREGLVALLDACGVAVLAQTGEAEEVDRLVSETKPDALVVDVRMPPRQVDEGLRAARRVREEHPDVAVVVLSQHVDVVHALDLLGDRRGGIGYLLKDHVASIAELREALEQVVAGGFVFDPDVVAELVGQRRHRGTVEALTPRERDVLELMARGLEQRRDRAPALDHARRGREARPRHLPEARPAGDARRQPARPRRDALPGAAVSSDDETWSPRPWSDRPPAAGDRGVGRRRALRGRTGRPDPVRESRGPGRARVRRRRELFGRPSHETIHYLRPDGSPYPIEECPLLEPQRTGQPVRVWEDWFVRRDRTLVPVSYSSAPIQLDDGPGSVVAFRDISAKRQLEAVERERLAMQERAAGLEASRARIAQTADAVERRIERDLHDGAQQQFGAIALRLELIRSLLDRDPVAAAMDSSEPRGSCRTPSGSSVS